MSTWNNPELKHLIPLVGDEGLYDWRTSCDLPSTSLKCTPPGNTIRRKHKNGYVSHNMLRTGSWRHQHTQAKFTALSLLMRMSCLATRPGISPISKTQAGRLLLLIVAWVETWRHPICDKSCNKHPAWECWDHNWHILHSWAAVHFRHICCMQCHLLPVPDNCMPARGKLQEIWK